MIHYYYGFGKGKTSSALGAGLRARGNGMSVLLVRFFKDNKSSELASAPFDIYPAPEKIPFNVSVEEYMPWVKNALDYISKCESDVIILDEFADLIPKFISFDEAKSVLADSSREYIITGHYHNEALYELADYVTRFEKEKHPYDNGVQARKGIEY